MSTTGHRNVDSFAQIVAALRDGPITAVGAAEMLGIGVNAAASNLNALERAGVARVDWWRTNSNGRPTAVYVFCPEPDMPSAEMPAPKWPPRKRRSPMKTTRNSSEICTA